MEIGFAPERYLKINSSSASGEDTVKLVIRNALLVFGKRPPQKKTVFINEARALVYF